MIFQKENYKKTIAPFRLGKTAKKSSSTNGQAIKALPLPCSIAMAFYCPRLSRCISSLNQEIGLILYFFFSYDKLTKTNIPVNVNISFAIEDVIKIEEINHKFHLKDKRVFLKTCLSLIYTFFHRMFELNSILSIFLSI